MCKRLGIEHRFAAICYPQTNGQETPFSLVFGAKDVLPLEVYLPNIRQLYFDEERNREQMRECLDFIDELRDQALY
ncbi:hypothetical protein LIER_17815 [Lithospermum erythrorhizon]|uniref:Uncharacterized protein n=1 Tax=Lithospermum erythrorhizon TaxID=34254 RepID=A0AAV3QEC5_LITER